MKAAQIYEYGNSEKIQIVDIDKPEVSAGKVLVEAYASSLNPFDTAIREGMYKDAMPLELPVTLGGDFAGIVSGIGEGVTHVVVGDKVYGQANAVAGASGAFAEYVLADADQTAKMPINVEFSQAGALPLVAVSAYQALNEHIKLQSGQKILIHGGSGGIGSIAIQLAKHLGAYVATTVPSDGIEFVKSLGADEVIDYKNQDFTELIRDYDAVFDTAGGDNLQRSIPVMKSGGVGVSMIAQADEALARDYGVTAIRQSTHVTTKALDAVRDLVEAGVLSVHVDCTYTLDQIREAFENRESGGVKGKVSIIIKQ